MMRAIEQRLRNLEARSGSPRVLIVWSDTSDEAEWERQIAELIARREASPRDKFMRIRWFR